MTEFTIQLANRPGQLAELTEALAFAGVNIEALAAFGVDEDGYVRIIVSDAATTRRTLRKAGLACSERSILTTVIGHEPGSLAKLTRRLAGSGVNIEALYLLNSHADGQEFALIVGEAEPAKELLQAL